MAISVLQRGFSYANIGVINQKIKPQKLCNPNNYYQKESSGRSLIQQLRSLWESFFGQQQFHRRPVMHLAFQGPPIGQCVGSKTLTKTWRPLSYESRLTITSILNGLRNDLKIGRLKILGFL